MPKFRCASFLASLLVLLAPAVTAASENRRPDAGAIEAAAQCGETEIKVAWRWRAANGLFPLEQIAVSVNGAAAMSAPQAAAVASDLNLLTAQGAFYRSARIACGVSSLQQASIVLEADQDYYSDAQRDLVLLRLDAVAGRVIAPPTVHRVRDGRGAQVPLRDAAAAG